MSTSQQWRAKAAEFGELANGTNEPGAIREFQQQQRSVTDLANNENWLANNFDKTVHPGESEGGNVGPRVAEEEEHVHSGDDFTLAENDERILRCLGVAVIMQWNMLPTKLQRELFDKASSAGDLLSTRALTWISQTR
jgi:hypothetical protein